MTQEKEMTVKEIIEKLESLLEEKRIRPDSFIMTEGCDCTGDVVRIDVSDEGTPMASAYLRRSK